jgi:hypothetical protein
MVEQLAGAGIGTLVVLGYLLLVEALTAAIVLLAQFIVLQVRALRKLSVVEPKPVVEPVSEPQGQTYRLGGDLKW